MSKKMLLTTNKYRISNESKNAKGFKVRTSGIDLSDFNNNPLLLWMHQRPKGEKHELLPIGNIVEIELINNELWGRLAFDPTDDFAVSLHAKYENGTLRMVSAGLIPLKFIDKDGETWLDASKLKEVSAVDIGANAESYGVKLYENSNELVTLSFDQLKKQHSELFKTSDMKMINLKADALLPLLKLSADADDTAVNNAIQTLVTLSLSQAADIKTKEAELVKLQSDYDGIVKLQNEKKVTDLVEGGKNDRRFTADQMPHFTKLANLDFDGTKALIDSMPKQPEVGVVLGADGADSEVAALVKLSYGELDASGKLETLKDKAPEVFKKMFKAEHGLEYQG